MAYESVFSISSAAADRKLVTQEEVEEMLGASAFSGITDATQLILQVSDIIANECRVPWADGANPPTLLQETIVETYRKSRKSSDGAWPYQDSERLNNSLYLSRFPASSITTVVADGVTLSASDYELRKSEGRLVRLVSDSEQAWSAQKIIITYVAGYATTPEPLKLAVIRAIQEQVSASARDPLLRGETVEGVGRFDYWVNSSASASANYRSISSAVAAMIEPYRYPLQ